MSDSNSSFYPPAYIAANKEQAGSLKSEASELGLSVDTVLDPNAAKWVLNHIESGVFLTPHDAISVAMTIFIQLEAYPDLRKELVRREMHKSFDGRGESIPGDEAFARIKEQMEQLRGRIPPAWVKVPFPETDRVGEDDRSIL